MKGKSLIVQLLSFGVAVIGSYSALFSDGVQAWLGIVAFAATLLLNSDMLASGTWPKGWSAFLWISNLAGIGIQILSQIGEKGLVDPNIVNYVITGINLFVFTFIKDYGTETSIVKS